MNGLRPDCVSLRDLASRCPEECYVTLNLLAFSAAAVFEIAGCFAFWIWLR